MRRIPRQGAQVQELARRRDGERDGEEAQRPQPRADLRVGDLVRAKAAPPPRDHPELGEPVEREVGKGNEAEQEDEDADRGVKQEVRSRRQKFLRRSMPA